MGDFYVKSEGYQETNSSFDCPRTLELHSTRDPSLVYEAVRADSAELVMHTSLEAINGEILDPDAFLALGQRTGDVGTYLALDAETAEAFGHALFEAAKSLRKVRGETKEGE